MVKKLLLLTFIISIYISAFGQLASDGLADLAEIKVDRFQKILDLSTSQRAQLKTETIQFTKAHGNLAYSKDLNAQSNKNSRVLWLINFG